MYRIGIDVGGTKINVGLFDEDTKALIACEKSYVADVTDFPAHVHSVVYGLCEKAEISFDSVSFCGVGIPGTVSKDGRRIVKVPNISILSADTPVEIECALNVPTRAVQDSRAAAWGEYLCGAGQGAESVVCVTLGTGIGTGIVLDGKIYDGALGCAGELGHTVAVEDGRECGCGRRGCVEKYAAGGGLDITAKALLGEGKTSVQLFKEAKNGNVTAQMAIADAVYMLGRALVSIVNLLSPSCVLFSGGLSAQEELYLNPLIEYIRSHCYVTDTLPKLCRAMLGELSPLYGAAFLPLSDQKAALKLSRKSHPQLSASLMCADVLQMGKALSEIEDAGIEYVHCDIMDNHFVPNLMIPTEFLNRLRGATVLPFDFHVMCEKPETVVEKLDIREGDFVSIHYESTVHLHRVISLVKSKGARAAVAINPATPVWVLDEILSEIEMVLVMSVNPGFAGQKIVPSSFEKIARLRQYLAEKGYGNILIEVDGCCSFENVPKMYDAGADVFVVGSSSVFRSGMTIREGADRLRRLINIVG